MAAMRPTHILLAAGLLALASPALAASHIDFMHLQAPSLNGAKKDCRVYFPASYDTPAGREKHYPVIVFLHGWPGSEGNWPGQGRAQETLDSLSASGAIPEVIALFPDGGGIGTLGRSIWLNAAEGKCDMETFIVRDLVAWADHTLRTKPEARYRGLIGLSDGATGAVNFVLRHPDVFTACGAHSGDMKLPKDFSSGRIFGDEPGATALRASYSPLLYVDKVAARVKDCSIYFDCGADDESVKDNREFDKRLTELGIPHTYHEFPGSHTWGYWKEHLRQSLRAVTAKMR
jgi:S-formylglutathione hydrolase FrmB